jgi:hypothetical protein
LFPSVFPIARNFAASSHPSETDRGFTDAFHSRPHPPSGQYFSSFRRHPTFWPRDWRWLASFPHS